MATNMREVVQSKVGREIETTCLELALEGERLCKSGDCHLGIQFLEAAVRLGTEDLKTLSAIYSQLGNAYFYTHNYGKALEFHRLDCNLARRIGDRLGEAKACGNIGNTLKVLGKFDEAIACCECHLRISREMSDKIGEARALYNLGNVFHARGKFCGRSREQDPGKLPPQVKEALSMAAMYYEENLKVVRELSDRMAEGRSCGNLGNTHYLLGNFHEAINYHSQRLVIAKEYKDLASERRAYSNLANCYIFLADFETAADNYLCSLHLARKLGDRTIEAQACYSLGNTYTLLRNYEKSAEFHSLHLAIAREVSDRIGEGRACWSLGNAYMALGQHAKALRFADLHYHISDEVGDESNRNIARLNIIDLRRLIGVSHSSKSFDQSSLSADGSHIGSDESAPLDYSDVSSVSSSSRVRRLSMEQMEILSLTPGKISSDEPTKRPSPEPESPQQKEEEEEALSCKKAKINSPAANDSPVARSSEEDADDFFSLLEKCQSRRMDEQRYELRAVGPSSRAVPKERPVLAEKQQSLPSKYKEQDKPCLREKSSETAKKRNSVHPKATSAVCAFPGLNASPAVLTQLSRTPSSDEKDSMPDDAFFEMLMRCQSTRIDDQRTSLPEGAWGSAERKRAPTVPDEDFLSLIHRMQATRLEEQRCNAPEGLTAGVRRKKRGFKK